MSAQREPLVRQSERRLVSQLTAAEAERDRYREALELIAANRWTTWGGKNEVQIAQDALDG